jgi:hypothetical protein
MARKGFGHYINAWLAEPQGAEFRDGKWRFWLPAVLGFTLLNAALTALIFRDGGQLENYMGAALVGIGGMVAWIAIGCLHYSDSSDRKLARGVSALDSATLVFVVAHLSFLLWCYGHLKTLQSAEAKYEAATEVYNVKAERISEDNKAIAEAARQIAIETTKSERLKNDAAYQMRKAAEAGARIPGRGKPSLTGEGLSISTSAVTLEKPTPPAESSVAFLTRWDAWIRVLNFGELFLAVVTLIFIRNRSASTNAPVEILGTMVHKISTPFGVTARSSATAPTPAFKNDTVSLKRDDTDERKKATRVVNREGLERLRECLSLIGFDHGPTHFKSDPKDAGYVWIRQYKSEHGEARMVASCRASIEILDDAMKMSPSAFRQRLERYLRSHQFEI